MTFQKTKTWKESNDPDKEEKLDRIEEVLERWPDRVFAFDEFGPLALHPIGGCCWAAKTKPQRLRANYHKTCGVRHFHACYSVGDDRLWGVVRHRKSAANTLAALRSIRAARPDGERIYVILDNLSAHKGKKIRDWCARNDVELCFTPTYSSWANPVECHFGPLRDFVLNNSDHPNHTCSPGACTPTCAGATTTPATPACGRGYAGSGPDCAPSANAAGVARRRGQSPTPPDLSFAPPSYPTPGADVTRPGPPVLPPSTPKCRVRTLAGPTRRAAAPGSNNALVISCHLKRANLRGRGTRETSSGVRAPLLVGGYRRQ